MFTFSVVVVDLPTDCILSFLFSAETDVLVPVFSQSTDVDVVNFVVVLKVPYCVTQGNISFPSLLGFVSGARTSVSVSFIYF